MILRNGFFYSTITQKKDPSSLLCRATMCSLHNMPPRRSMLYPVYSICLREHITYTAHIICILIGLDHILCYFTGRPRVDNMLHLEDKYIFVQPSIRPSVYINISKRIFLVMEQTRKHDRRTNRWAYGSVKPTRGIDTLLNVCSSSNIATQAQNLYSN